MKKENSKSSIIIIIVLIAIVFLLITYIVSTLIPKNKQILGNKSLEILGYANVPGIDSEDQFLIRVKNTSTQTFVNANLYAVYYDHNNMPMHEAWSGTIKYFKPNSIRIVRLYDTIDDYSKAEIGLFNAENDKNMIDLMRNITYQVEKTTEQDANGNVKLLFTGANDSNKTVDLLFQNTYWDKNNKFIDGNSFNVIVNPNSEFSFYNYFVNKYNDGTPFPKGYTCNVVLVEALEADSQVINQ